MYSLVSLEILSLNGNKLEELPVEICYLPSLRELRVCNNNLHSLPLEIGLLQQINKMFLSQNKIKELPEVRQQNVFSLTICMTYSIKLILCFNLKYFCILHHLALHNIILCAF